MSEANRKINFYREKYGFTRWDLQALGRVFDWGGHVAWFSKWSPQRLAFVVLRFRGSKYLDTLEHMCGSQLHGRRFKGWRWEQQFSIILGADWQTLALDQEVWADHKSFWLSRRIGDDVQ